MIRRGRFAIKMPSELWTSSNAVSGVISHCERTDLGNTGRPALSMRRVHAINNAICHDGWKALRGGDLGFVGQLVDAPAGTGHPLDSGRAEQALREGLALEAHDAVAPYQSTLGLAVPGGFCVRASQRLTC